MKIHGASRPSSLADPDGTNITIRNDALRAVFHPVAGGRLGSLRHARHGDLIVPFIADTFDPSTWPKSGAFPLFPFHNMLRHSTFEHEGRPVRLRPNMPGGKDVMHGPAHRRAWSVSYHGEEQIALTLDYHADGDWPFDFRATQRFELHQDQLTVKLYLTNTGREHMPGGLGWHPYFRASKDGVIGLDATRRWTPFGPAGMTHDSPVAPLIRLALGSTWHYSGWTQATAVVGDGARITLSGQGALTCFAALHKEAYLCLEPVSHVAGALAGPQTPTDTGLRHLAPSESMCGTIILSVA
ncbi:hypothetical protein [Roseinatronobacter alkalisoli]|uniref:Aldose 1-epimerase n=1 Tax=Roseinatronobacter alkalisoli TaxID=3028235 RepID=A0ABT5TDW2_9RHOB|nr:hypothetical protein [Roseinatronobacter sp. HJB301]MDD7973300.1 hypothetical protein [Roseinatronobacter sp. HJB301]